MRAKSFADERLPCDPACLRRARWLQAPSRLSSLHTRCAPRDERGAVMVEYAVILVLVALGCVAAIVAVGIPLAGMYLTQRTWVLLPFP